MSDDSTSSWFLREILPHESALTGYISRLLRRPGEVPDVRQEIYVKVLEAAEEGRPRLPKPFLFTVARNHIFDRARHNRIVRIDLVQDLEALDVMIDEVSAERSASSQQQLMRVIRAFDKLPSRCRQVLWMRRFEGISQREIARVLGIGEGTVEGYAVKGMRLLAAYCGSDAAPDSTAPANSGPDAETRHGN